MAKAPRAQSGSSPSASGALWKQFELQVSLLLEEYRRQPRDAASHTRSKSAKPPAPSQISGQIARRIDHTLLKPDATREEILAVCAQALEHGFASVCVQSGWIPEVARALAGQRSVMPIAVIGFPHGAALTAAKAAETRLAVRAGAREIDMVIPVGRLKSREFQYVLADIRAVVLAAGRAPVKVILETALLSEAEKVAAAVLAELAGAAFVKTCTGFAASGSTVGATVEDIRLLRDACSPRMRIKASGGIRSRETAEKLIQAGADRLGTSSGVAIVSETQPTPNAAGGY
jgi:deoxyribose-phosphate aldolase